MTTPATPALRCDWSDLPKTQCGHCQGVGPTVGRINLAPPEPRYPAGTRVAWSPTTDKAPTPRDWHDGDKAPATGTRCSWNRAAELHVLPEHLPACDDRDCNGCKPCTHDDHGDPVRHCRTRAGCTEHLNHAHPLTCPRCIARVRAKLAHIERLTALMPDQAANDGLESGAAMIAGPAGNPETIQRRSLLYVEAAHGLDDPHAAAVRALAHWEDDTRDEAHPLYVLRDWEQRIREHYNHPIPRFADADVRDIRHVGQEKPPTLARAVSYLSWVLTDLAQDRDQDYPQFAAEIDDLVRQLENTLGASRAPERGAPCKDCDEPAPRLVRRRAHWCDREDCTREHDKTGARDTWVCPANPRHWWTEADYRKWSYERADETKGKIGA